MKVLKILGLVCVCVVGMISLLWWGCGPHQPSDQSLEKRFYKQRPDLERLVAMMNEDSQMSRIAPDFTWRQDTVAWPRPESQWGISGKRWDEYREIFSRAGFADGTTRRGADVIVDVWSWGIVPAGISVGYLHCGQTRNGYASGAPPCGEKRDSGTGMYGHSTSFGYRYKKITEDWYILEESN
jgi:hypothetical protein